ncbi:MAG TPA: ABC transporter substrate-binding protein [Anaerovoracaceae bacterium]|nr:ABC transporter substrate-binding protein [Anaerovoracaceae bacterium]
MKKYSLTLYVAFLMILSIIFTACGSDGGPVDAPETSKMVVGIPQDFDSLDPHISEASGTEEVMFNVFTGLAMPSADGELIPALAESWDINDDSSVFTFYLRKDVLFHDGSEFTAADVKYTYDRVCGKIPGEEGVIRSTYSDVIKDVEIIDEYTVRLNLIQSDAKFMSVMYFGIIPEGSGPDQATDPVGAGPYKVLDYTPGVGINLVKFDDYYEPGLPKIENVEFKIFADLNAGVLALTNGEIQYMAIVYDMVSQIPDEGFVVEQYPMNAVQLMGLNNEFEPFKDIRVRQALNYAIDKQEIISMLAPGAPEVDSNFSPVMAYWYEDLSDFYEHDIEKAKNLLAEAGYSDLTFTVKVPSEYPIHVNAAQIIEQQYKEAGITMKIQVIDWNTWLEDVYDARNHEATIIGLTGKLDPDSILKRFSSTYSKNFINFENAGYDQMIEEGIKESDSAKRVELYKEAQRILTEEAASVFIMDPINYVAVDANLKGFTFYPINFIDLRYFEYK